MPPQSSLPSLQAESPSDLEYPSGDDSSEDEYFSGPQVGCEFLDDWYYYCLRPRCRCPSSCTKRQGEKEDAPKGGAYQEEATSHQEIPIKKVVAVEVSGLSSQEYSFECSFKFNSNMDSPQWI